MKHTGIIDGLGRTIIVEEAQSIFDAIYAPRGWVTATQTEADAFFGAPEPDDTLVTTAQLTAALAGFTPSGGSSVASLTPTAVKTANYTAAASDYVPVDTTSGNVTVTLPTAPADKTQVGVKHVVRGGTNTVTIACGGSDVLNKTGGSTTGTLTLLNQGAVLQYKASTAVWYVTSDDLPLSQLDARYQAAGAFTDRGAWATTTAYVVGDEVSYNYTRYIAKTAHTSGSLFDPTKFVKTGSLNGRCVRVPDGWGTYWKTARATAGSALVPVHVTGDSLTDGQSASTLGNSWAGLMGSALQAAYGDGGSGFVGVARQIERGGWTFSTGQWTQAFNAAYSVGPGGNDGATSTVNGATATVTGRGTTVEVYYRTSGSSGSGSATVSIDGGTAVAISENRADGTTINKISRYRVTGLSAGTHTVTVTNVGTAGIKLHGARFTNATGVVIDNHGASGHRSGSASLTTAGPPDPRPWQGGYEMPAQLAVWAYGVNDVSSIYGTPTTIQQFNLALTLWAESVQESTNGCCDLIIIAPHVGTWETLTNLSGGYTANTYSELVAEMKATADRFGAVFIDLWGLGRGSWNWMNDRGYWSDGSAAGGASAGTDGVHLSNAGHAWWYSYVGPIVLDQATPETVTPPAAYKPKARLTQTATSGINPKTVVFDASTSYAAFPKTISTYTFNPGDGSGNTTQASPVFSRTYTSNGTFTPTVTVTDSAGTTSVATGSAVTISAAMAFQDTFTDTDSVLITAHTPNQGAAWSTHGVGGAAWNIGISGNMLAQLSAGSGTAMIAQVNLGVHDTVITAVVGTDGIRPLECWFVDDSNYVNISTTLQVQKVVAGSTTTVGTGSTTLAAGDTVTITLSGTSVTVAKNGTNVNAGVTIADSVFTTATNLGVSFGFGSGFPKKFFDSIQAT